MVGIIVAVVIAIRVLVSAPLGRREGGTVGANANATIAAAAATATAIAPISKG